MRKSYWNQTVTTNGADDAFLQGNVNMTVNFPQVYPKGTWDAWSAGNNSLTLNGYFMGQGYTANINQFSGKTLSLQAGFAPGVHINTTGAGTVKANVSLGAKGGPSTMDVGAPDHGSNYAVVTNGTLSFSKLTFMQQASSVTLDDRSTPVGSMGGHVPTLIVKGLADLRDVDWSPTSGLKLDFADPLKADITWTGMKIAKDAGLFSATQEADGDLVIKPTAAWGGQVPGQMPTYNYAAPLAGAGEEVFKLAA